MYAHKLVMTWREGRQKIVLTVSSSALPHTLRHGKDIWTILCHLSLPDNWKKET